MDNINDLIGDAAKQLMAQAPPQERIKRELGFGRRKS